MVLVVLYYLRFVSSNFQPFRHRIASPKRQKNKKQKSAFCAFRQGPAPHKNKKQFLFLR